MDYWLKQTQELPLFEDILWSRPETRHGAGKLLVIGGNLHGFAAAGNAYAAAQKAGAGTIRLVLPDALKKTLGHASGPYEFAPSTPSGSFAQDALNELLIGSNWADSVLLAGDIGKNSETAILLENFVQKYTDQLTLTGDVIEYFYHQPGLITERVDTVLVLNLSQLQKLGTALKFETPFLHDMGMLLLVQVLHDFSQRWPVTIITKEQDNFVVAHQGKVSSTKLTRTIQNWQVDTAASASVFLMQNKNRPFEAVTSSLVAE